MFREPAPVEGICWIIAGLNSLVSEFVIARMSTEVYLWDQNGVAIAGKLELSTSTFCVNYVAFRFFVFVQVIDLDVLCTCLVLFLVFGHDCWDIK